VQKREPQIVILHDKRDNLLANESCENPNLIKKAVEDVDESWDNLRNTLAAKSAEFLHEETKQNFILDVSETELWIEEKAKIIDATKDYGESLAGVLALQRKLGTMQRDVDAIKQKKDMLKNDAEKIQGTFF
jgi:spectrin beta